MGSPPTSTTPRKLRWYQFSLRTALILMLLAALACSWFAVKLRQAQKRQEVVNNITRIGGWVLYDYDQSGDCNWIQGGKPPGPDWLRRILGEQMFCDVYSVAFRRRIGDADLEQLECLTQLRALDVKSPITDEGLKHLAKLHRLQFLGLRDSTITDAGLQHLAGLKGLRRLGIFDTEITDAGLQHLRGLQQLEELTLPGSHITDAGLPLLAGLTQLKSLDVRRSHVSDAGLDCLRSLPQLEWLFLSQTRVTGDGLRKLQGFKRLESLSVDDTQLNDAGFRTVIALPALKYLDVLDTGGLGTRGKALRKALPKVQIQIAKPEPEPAAKSKPGG